MVNRNIGLENNTLNGLDKIEFEVMIKGTPPKWEDEFSIFVQIYDSTGKELAEFNSRNSKAQKTSSENWVHHKVVITQKDLLGTNASKIWIVERGKDIEYWAGHFGTRFAQEKLALTFSESSVDSGPTKNIKKIFGTRKIPNILPFATNFNKSMGNKFYLNGHIIKKGIKYNNYNDSTYTPAIFTGQLVANPTSKFAYYGTHCLEITGKLEKFYECQLKLHDTLFSIEDGLFKISVVHFTENISQDIEISIGIEDSYNNMNTVTLDKGEETKLGDEELQWSTSHKLLNLSSLIQSSGSQPVMNGIYIIFKNNSDSEVSIHTYFGKLSVIPRSYIPVSCVENIKYEITTLPVISPVHKTYNIRLTWEHNWGKDSKTFNRKYLIFRDQEWIGVTTLQMYLDKSVNIRHAEGEVSYKIQAIGEALEEAEKVEIVIQLQ